MPSRQVVNQEYSISFHSSNVPEIPCISISSSEMLPWGPLGKCCPLDACSVAAEDHNIHTHL